MMKKLIKLLAITMAVLLVVSACGSNNAFQNSYLFSEYSGVEPMTVSDEDDFSTPGIVRETFSNETDWSLIDKYGTELEKAGFVKEDKSASVEKYFDILWKYTKVNEKAENGQYCDQVIINKYPSDAHFADTIQIQVQMNVFIEGETNKKPEQVDKQENVIPDKESTGEKNALRSAKGYLNSMAFSYSGLVKQLEYEGYTNSEATYAADHCDADWNEQAVESAKDYLNSMAFSYTGLIDQLEYEGYTSSQAKFGADNCNADWNEQAVKSASEYLASGAFSRQELIEQLIYEGFSEKQAEFGVSNNGY